MQAIKLLSLLACCLFFVACTQKPLEIIKTQEVHIPVACSVTMPNKPQFKENLQSSKELLFYYVEVERLLQICIKQDRSKQ